MIKVPEGGIFMNGDTIFGMLIITFCSILCAAIFYGIGDWAVKRNDPMHFYSGVAVKPESISDVPAYNRENGRMWKVFSVPFWLSAFCSILSFWDRRFSTISIVLLVAGCTVGSGFLIARYHKILKKYTVR